MCKKIDAFVAAILLACIFSFSNSANAQSFSIGPRIGMNLSTVSGLDMGDTTGLLKSSSTAGFVFGAVANIGINEMFSIQPELLYSQQGVMQEMSADFFGVAFKVKARTRLNYINLPVLAKVSFGPENIKGFVTAGPTFGYLLGGNVKSEVEAGGQTEEETQDLSDDDLENMNRMDIGLSFGAGVALGAGPGNLNIDLRYGLGLSDINKIDGPKPDNYEAAKNGVFSISVAYLFNLAGE